jgi:hypothetical protein
MTWYGRQYNLAGANRLEDTHCEDTHYYVGQFEDELEAMHEDGRDADHVPVLDGWRLGFVLEPPWLIWMPRTSGWVRSRGALGPRSP